MEHARALQPDVWSIFSAASLPPDCINLGQGYMNFAPPAWACEGAETALKTAEGNQAAPVTGVKRLREAIKAFYGTQFGKELDAETEIVVTGGAIIGIHAVLTAFVGPGDEVVIFEPFFDHHISSAVLNGGKPVYVPLHPSQDNQSQHGRKTWSIDFDELRRAITARTKMIILNTPHNPVGKVLTRQELEAIAELARKHNLLVFSDEVYETIVYDNREHIRIASLPGMWERTLTVSSTSKLFAATGWRVGWLIGPPELVRPAFAATLRMSYCTNTPMQEAAALSFERAAAHDFFAVQLQEYAEKRALLTGAFERVGIAYTVPEGGYFVLVDVSRVRWPDDYPFPVALKGRGRDFRAAWFIAVEVGVSSIPLTAFYCEEHQEFGENYLRVAFCKDVDTVKRAAERLQNLKNYIL
ncbi:hypothetical protein IEO21_02880 [Rhodonia placenta]|uniref:Aminotransferase class I/classII large domain-containing protein n=1 Tax=Rhodonia placenta TaxID=104341 RepID=A0A8H7P723_9APHY|nr:hypothetical protein IEO21_02880 [Postia placenta]